MELYFENGTLMKMRKYRFRSDDVYEVEFNRKLNDKKINYFLRD